MDTAQRRVPWGAVIVVLSWSLALAFLLVQTSPLRPTSSAERIGMVVGMLGMVLLASGGIYAVARLIAKVRGSSGAGLVSVMLMVTVLVLLAMWGRLYTERELASQTTATGVNGDGGQPPDAIAAVVAPEGYVQEPRSEGEVYLGYGAANLTPEQFSIASQEWLRHHLEYNDPNSIAAIQAHLDHVLVEYPAIEARAAFDMALQRALRAGREYEQSAKAREGQAQPAWASKEVRETRDVPARDGATTENYTQELATVPMPVPASTQRGLPLNSVDIPSWEAIRTGRSNERVNPIDPSKVVHQESK
jgi:hypothetical protein